MRQIVILILVLLIVYTGRRLFYRSSVKKGNSRKMVRDPVCNIYIPESEAVKKVIGGETFFFCSIDCAEKIINLRQRL